MPHHRLAVDHGQHLVLIAHAGRLAGGENDCGDFLRLAGICILGIPGIRIGTGQGAGRDFLQQPAMPHFHDGVRRDRQACEQALQHPVEAVQFRRPGAARQADDGYFRVSRCDASGKDQIAWIDRHAEMIDDAAGSLDRRRDDVAPVGNGAGAGDQQQIGRICQRLADGVVQCLVCVVTSDFPIQRAGKSGKSVTRNPGGFVQHCRLHTG